MKPFWSQRTLYVSAERWEISRVWYKLQIIDDYYYYS